MKKFKVTTMLACSIVLLSIMAATFAETRYKVRSTDNLNKIIAQYYEQSDLTRSQLLVGILAKNQEAFRGGNINFLLSGKQLILPDESDIETLSDQEAKALLGNHARAFRRGETGNFGSPISNRKIVSKNQNAQALENKQLVQTVKIDQLEKESEDLRKRLDKLIAEKNESDAKLRKVEEDLQNTLNRSGDTAPALNSEPNPVDIEKDKKKITEKIDTFQSINSQKSQISNGPKKDLTDNSPLDQKITSSEASQNGFNLTTLLSLLKQFYWYIIALGVFLILLYFWGKYKRKTQLVKKEANLQPEIEKAYLQEQDFLNVQVKEAPLKSTIKLDMAKAYLDAGDIDSATEVLNVIINEGSASQRKQAQKLLNAL